MPNTTGSNQQQKFVGRFEMAIMQFAILNKAKQQGGVTKDNLKQLFQNELRFEHEHLDHCLDQLTQENHLRKEGNNYVVTDDGREDVQKVQHLVVDLPNVIGMQGGGQQQRGLTQQRATGGGSTGTTQGTQPDVGTSTAQGSRAGSQQGSREPGHPSTQSGVSGQRNTADVSKGGATQPAGDKGNRR